MKFQGFTVSPSSSLRHWLRYFHRKRRTWSHAPRSWMMLNSRRVTSSMCVHGLSRLAQTSLTMALHLSSVKAIQKTGRMRIPMTTTSTSLARSHPSALINECPYHAFSLLRSPNGCPFLQRQLLITFSLILHTITRTNHNICGCLAADGLCLFMAVSHCQFPEISGPKLGADYECGLKRSSSYVHLNLTCRVQASTNQM